MAGYLEWKVTRVRSISDHFVGAVDSGRTATVSGLEHFSDTPVTVGLPMRLRVSNSQPLKHYGQKKVELLSNGGEKMHVTFI